MTYQEHLERKKKALAEMKAAFQSSIGEIESSPIDTQAHSLKANLSAAIEFIIMYMDKEEDAKYEIEKLRKENEELKKESERLKAKLIDMI